MLPQPAPACHSPCELDVVGVTIASISRRIRDIPTEVILDEADGMPKRCAVRLDNLGEAWQAMLVEHVTTLQPARMRDVCDALDAAVGC